MADAFDHVTLGPDEAESIRHRRSVLGLDGADAWPLTGLALSGGGVRSATFALGLLQGMAHADRLDRVDVMSTVSGGGYAGAFLRSLFIPRSGRFRDKEQGRVRPSESEYRRRHDWAMKILKSAPAARQLDGDLGDEDARHFAGGPVPTANPIWWLREHGRYLAPNGSGDYLFALGYIVRGWFAMQYVAIVPLIGVFLGFKLLAACLHHFGKMAWPPAHSAVAKLVHMFSLQLSPLMLLPVALLLLVVMPVSTSYWLTATVAQWRFKKTRAVWVVVMLVAASIVALYIMTLGVGGVRVTDGVLRLGGYFCFVQVAAAGVLMLAQGRAGDPRHEVYPSELRRLLTAWLATVARATLFLLILALVDSLALFLVERLRAEQAAAVIRTGGLGAIVVTAIVWLVQKVQVWLPRFGNAQMGAAKLTRFVPAFVFLAGTLAYGIMAVLCASVGYLLVWQDIPFRSEPTFLPAVASLVLVVLLTLVTGLSPRFLNLSSLHYFYGGRLTRAYLGATNARRLAAFERTEPGRTAANVQEYDEGDALCLADYHRREVLAPVHLINITANETRQTNSQLVQRDRKGSNLCVGPGGISLGGEWRSKAELAAQDAERLAVGKWIAISGAAASSAMGQATTLGTALLLTFANVRLGYWWYAPELAGRMPAGTVTANIAAHRQKDGSGETAGWRLSDVFETQSYLLNEATAAYSRVGRLRLNLSDGGHFENSAAYELIRRRLPLIVVSDAAADPHYEFEDLSNLVRKARIDLGAEVRCLSATEIEGLPASVREFCGGPETFRQEQGTDLRCLVPCRIDYADSPPSLLMLVKPRVPKDASVDVAVYRRTFPAFPQEPTADQFFGEAQWESYRALGEMLGRRIFPGVIDEMVAVVGRWRAPALLA